ncbi:MAG: hypothetical protein PHX68_00700 [Alphaproteobacteria bacterium]|nr:hypothetical protein [Alphaproteobacteria bacterium]
MVHMKMISLMICGILAVGLPGGIARADGEVVETALLPDEWGEPAEDALATLTADGDFLLPTYAIPDDITDIPETPLALMPAEQQAAPAEAPKAAPPVVAARAPAPTPVSPPAAPGTRPLSAEQPTTPLLLGTGHAPAALAVEAPAKKPVLVKLGESQPMPEREVKIPAPARPVVPSDMADRVIAGIKAGRPAPVNMPSEMKITFYPKVAEFSGTTVKWIKAFALKALQDPNTIILIRASAADKALQTTRARLVIQALKSAGLSTHQIRMAFVDRPADTLVLQVLPKPDQTRVVPVKPARSSDKRRNVSTKEW